jgi:hypothetical protein
MYSSDGGGPVTKGAPSAADSVMGAPRDGCHRAPVSEMNMDPTSTRYTWTYDE